MVPNKGLRRLPPKQRKLLSNFQMVHGMYFMLFYLIETLLPQDKKKCLVGHAAVMQTDVHFMVPEKGRPLKSSASTPMIRKHINSKSPTRKTQSGLSDISSSTVTTSADSNGLGTTGHSPEVVAETGRKWLYACSSSVCTR